MSIGAADRMTYWRLVLLLADWISRREDAVIYRAGLAKLGGLARAQTLGQIE
jgi:hypothetical protein